MSEHQMAIILAHPYTAFDILINIVIPRLLLHVFLDLSKKKR